jgi:hypothetical protein
VSAKTSIPHFPEIATGFTDSSRNFHASITETSGPEAQKNVLPVSLLHLRTHSVWSNIKQIDKMHKPAVFEQYCFDLCDNFRTKRLTFVAENSYNDGKEEVLRERSRTGMCIFVVCIRLFSFLFQGAFIYDN